MPSGAAVLVAPADAPELGRAMLVEVEMALAAAALMRVAKRPPPATIVQPGAWASAQVAGGLGAIVLAALRRAHKGLALRILSAGPARALEARPVWSCHGAPCRMHGVSPGTSRRWPGWE